MTDNQFQRQMAIFDAACDLPEDEREAYLVEACGDDAPLLDKLRQLLTQAGKDDGLHIVSEAASNLLAETDRAGQELGHFRLLRRIGTGGMGDVYLAERSDGEYTQQVAIKLMQGSAQSGPMLERFRAERQILAQLKHPNVAQLIDGGVSEQGHPYFVMEYVEGIPLDEFCDQQRLSIRKRLQLFRDVCAAVAFAHGNLVVHRDLKPSNILVTPDGQVKLLDFGIAKVIDERAQDAQLTRTGMSIMTPSYASPEQALGLPVTTATDIYSLGVILYKLMSGRRPYEVDNTNPVQAAEIISRVEPDRASTVITQHPGSDAESTSTIAAARNTDARQLQRSLAGDIDTLCAKAMHKEPSRRYASALALAEDIERHLDGLPIRARPDSFAYRSGKFLRRNRLAVAASVAVVATIAGVVGTYTWHLSVAKREAEGVSRFLADVLMSATPAELGVGGSVLDLVDGAAEKVETDYADDPLVRSRVHHILGVSYFRMGRYEQAKEQTEKALALREDLLGPAAFETRRTRANLMTMQGALNQDISALVADQQRNNPRKPDQWTIHLNSTRRQLAAQKGDMEGALAMAEQVYDDYREMVPESYRPRIMATMNLATLLYDFERHDEAEAKLLEAIRHAEAAGEKDLVATIQMELGLVYDSLDRNEEALDLFRKSLAFDTESRGEVNLYSAITLINIAGLLNKMGRIDEAIDAAQQALDMKIAVQGEDHEITLSSYETAGVIIAKRDFETGRRYLEKAVEGTRAWWPDGHWRIGQAHAYYAIMLGSHEHYEEAVEQGELAWAMYEEHPHSSTTHVRLLAEKMAGFYKALGDEDGEKRWTGFAESVEDPAT